jgi:hypothetical protein
MNRWYNRWTPETVYGCTKNRREVGEILKSMSLANPKAIVQCSVPEGSAVAQKVVVTDEGQC